MKLDELKKDPLYAGFVKGAHARGITNAQLSWVLETHNQRESMRSDPAVAEQELRRDFPSNEAMQQALTRSYRATAAYAGNDEARAKLEVKFGNDPDFIRIMARIGGEMGEDTAVTGGLNASEDESLQSLMSHAAYHDAKHPEHKLVVARTSYCVARRDFAGCGGGQCCHSPGMAAGYRVLNPAPKAATRRADFLH